MVPVLFAVEEGDDPCEGSGVTVGLVADRLGLDPSRASRMVSATIQAGYLSRVASQTDGRRINLELTEAGKALAAEAHAFREAQLDRALAAWTPGDRAEFARLLTRFAEDVRRTPHC
jgi:DNA-binding MarR family transcriptional regulator